MSEVSSGSRKLNPIDLKAEFVRTFRAVTSWPLDPEIDTSLSWLTTPDEDGTSPDDIVIATRPDKTLWVLALQHSRTGYPRDIEAAERKLQQHLSMLRERGPDDVPIDGVVLADAISEQSRTQLRSAGIGFFDSGGSLHLEHDPAFIHVERPPPRIAKARPRSLFSPTREQVILALLKWEGEDGWISTDSLCDMSKASLGTVTETLKELRLMDWLEVDQDGRKIVRRLTERSRLLDAWGAYRKTRRDPVKRYFHGELRPEDHLAHIAKSLGDAQFDWALTGDAGANVLGPYLTGTSDWHLSVANGRVSDVARMLRLTEVREGGNYALIERPGLVDFMFLQLRPKFPGLRLPSAEVLYTDLLGGRGRSKDAADNLRKTLIRY